ncbi:MAG: hypothetical protein WCB53_07520 [Terriglobales bacterium]
MPATILRAEGVFARIGTLRPSGLRRTVMAVHRGFGHSGRCASKRTPHATLHGRRSNASHRQRPEDRDQHDQQRDSGCPAVHDYCFARFTYEPIPHTDCAHHTIGGGAKASAKYWRGGRGDDGGEP